MEENIVKHTCKELGITYKQLGEAIGYSENSVSNAARSEVSRAMARAIELYMETLELKEKLQDYNTLQDIIKKAIK